MCEFQIDGKCWCDKFLSKYRGLDTLITSSECKGYYHKCSHSGDDVSWKKVKLRVVSFEPAKFEYGAFHKLQPKRYLKRGELE